MTAPGTEGPDNSPTLPDGNVPKGRSSFDLPLGPLRVRIVDLPTTWRFVADNYGPFCDTAGDGPAPDLVVTCREESPRVVVPLPPPGGTTVIQLEREAGQRHRIRSHWQDGFVDPADGRGEVVFTDRGYLPFRMTLENYLRVASQLLLLARGCFLIHGAGVLDQNRCFLFFGASGAGKSTATSLSAPRRALSDDIVLLDVSSDTVTAHAVPFCGAFPREQRVRGIWPVTAACRLRQSPQDRLVRLSMAQAVATVSASVPFVHELGQSHEGLTRLVARFCSLAPVHELYFTKTSRFWSLILEQFPG